MSHSAEEKIKILYEDSLREIRELTAKLERVAQAVTAAANSINNGKTILRAENEKLLLEAVGAIRVAVEQIAGVQANITSAAAQEARAVLLGNEGPVAKLDALVRQQREALGWLNRAAEFYKKSYVLWPMVVSTMIGGLIGGAVIRFV